MSSKINEIRNVTKMVEAILTDNKNARNSDDYLYYAVCYRISREKNIPLEQLNAEFFLLNRSQLGFPNHETVRRARQKLQHDNPLLAADGQVEAYRDYNEEVFKGYVRSI